MKIKGLQSALIRKKSDFALFCNTDITAVNANMLYFSGYAGIGALIIPKKQNPFLVVPKMELERARNSMVKRTYSMEKKRFFDTIHGIIRKKKIKKRSIAIDKNSFTLNSYSHIRKQFRPLKTKDVAKDCLKLRIIKTEKEMQFLKSSCHYADMIVQKAIKNFKKFRTESEAAAFLEHEAKKLGLGLSFSPIVASGSNSSIPHHEPSSAKIKKGFCVIDFGVKYNGYCSDIARTIYVGKPSEKEKEIYNFLLNIQQNAIKEIKKNKKCSELYNFVAKSLGNYKKYFTHGLGHGVGVEIHELPNLTLNSKDKIKNNMVFTIEPGVYFPKKFGIRIEDTVLFKKKVEVLTQTPKELIILKS